MTSTAADTSRQQADAALAGRSRRGRHLLVPDCGHWIPLDAPAAVVGAIAMLVREIRESRS
jgi:hypothetical protein